MIKQKSVGRNWSLLYRKIYEAKIKRLTERNERTLRREPKNEKKISRNMKDLRV
jgi:hypothetical protein